MSADICDEIWRTRIAKMARAKSRIIGAPPKFPSDWKPRTIINPNTGLPLNDPDAFELIAIKVETSFPIEIIALRVPPGDQAFVMRFPYGPNQLIYVKFQVKHVFLGRSFHHCLAGLAR